MDVQPKSDDKKKPPVAVVPESIDFFEELPIPINIEGGKNFMVFMRLLKVKEIPILNRIVYMQERDPNSEQAAIMLISLAASTLNVSSDEVPVEASSGLVKNMISFNFPKKDEPPDDKPDDKPKKDKQKNKNGLVNCIDFLIANGHKYGDIMEYTVKVFDNFIVTIADRLGDKQKPTDPAEAFRKLGLKVKPRGDKNKP
ncbi:MAG: hypothetical protein KAR42_18000 [candidate division Zixibacteria bacterium]|nr:hypothetical protein [candidate division Zixibacteria bacterium]